jgi:hypothetical protein
MRRTRLPLLLLTLGGLALAGPALAADEGDCATDADCSTGMVCEVTGGSACACPSEGPCEPCDTVFYRECVPGPCETDADCGADLICVAWEEDCGDVPIAVPPCPPDSSCEELPAPPREECQPVKRSACAPKWAAPCEAATDCGVGFNCVAVENCTCSGGGGIDTPAPTEPGQPSDPAPAPDGEGSGSEKPAVPADDGAGAPAPPEDDRPDSECTCEPSGEKMCEPQEVSCETADECPSGWSCEKFTVDSAPCAWTPEGGSSCEDAAPIEPSAGTCYPPGFELYLGLGGGHGVPSGTATDSEVSTPTAPGEGSGTNDPKNAVAGGGTGPTCGGGQAPAMPLLAVLGLMLMAVVRRRTAAARS